MRSAASLSLGAAAAAASPLPPHTVSGFSAGGDMAVNHFVAFSSAAAGVGVVAGAPYGCNVLKNAEQACGVPPDPGKWDEYLEKVNAYLAQRAADGLIDPLSGLKGKPVYLFSGKKDNVVSEVVMQAVEKQLGNLTGAHVWHQFTVKASHAWVVDDYVCPKPGIGRMCGTCGSWTHVDPMVNNCGYDLSGNMLKRFITSLQPRTHLEPQSLYQVGQAAYVPGNKTPGAIGMDSTALLYLPAACAGGGLTSCRVHVHYHGCSCHQQVLGTDQVMGMGLLEWAEPNRIVVLFPQMASWAKDESGCWDWEGETGSKFDTHSGKQLHTVTAMLRDLSNLVASRVPAPPSR